MGETSLHFFEGEDDADINQHRIRTRIDAQMAIDGAFLIDLAEDMDRYGLTQEQINEYFRTGAEPPYDL